MVKFNSFELSELVAKNIMIYHDSEDYNGLEKNTCKIIEKSGYSKDKSLKSGKIIRNIYENYDLAQKYREEKKTKKEKVHYKKAKDLAEKLNRLLKTKYDNKLLVEIVYNWRHRNKISILYLIFKNWMQKLNYALIPSIKATKLMIKAAHGHDERDYEKFRMNFEKIYDICIELKLEKMPVVF